MITIELLIDRDFDMTKYKNIGASTQPDRQFTLITIDARSADIIKYEFFFLSMPSVRKITEANVIGICITSVFPDRYAPSVPPKNS